MITAAQWVPRGKAAENPVQADLDDAEMQRIQELAQLELEEAQEELADAQAVPPAMDADSGSGEDNNDDDDDLKDFHMDKYDDELAEDNSIAGVHNLAYHAPDEEDQYLTLPTEQDLDEEREELRITPSENMLLAAKTEDDLSLLEIYVYDDEEANLWVHHDIMLPSFPLCLEWVPTRPGSNGETGNFVAIGTFEPEIELWDLDVVDGVFPTAILGSSRVEAEARGTGKKKRKMKKPSADYHVDAVLSLASNRHHANLLASGSADTTIKLWDLAQPDVAAASFVGYHKNKVSSVAWHPSDATVLASGGYDGFLRIGDLRSDNLASDSRSFQVSGDVEGVAWGPDGISVYVATDKGTVCKFDARASSSKPLWTLQAHDAEITSFAVNEYVDDFMVTTSVDKMVKLWNLSGDQPSMLLSRDMDVGKVFSASFGPEVESRGLIAIAGSENRLKVWDSFSNKTVRDAMARGTQVVSRERIIMADSDSSSEDEESSPPE